MFTKTPEDRPARAGGSSKVSVLSSDLEITGSVTSTGSIDISAHIDGEVEAKIVSLGSEGVITGKLRAGSADIMGQLQGDVTADSLTLRSSAKAVLVATSGTLVIESGAVIEGKFNKPAAPAPAKPAPIPTPQAASAPAEPAPDQPREGGIE